MILEKKLEKAIKNEDIIQMDYVFEEIYNKYYNLVSYIISQYIKNINDIEELVNDTFVNFYNNCFKVKIDNIKYYLVKSSKNISIDFIKKKQVIYEYNEDYINNYKEDREKTIYDEIMILLEKCLSKEEIKIILLYNIDCYSLKEISKMLNKPYNSVVSIYNRAIKKVKKEVNKNVNG